MLHDLGVRILRYLDDWLVLASSRMEALWARDIVLNLCQQLGIMVSLAKSRLNPSRTATYLGMSIESPSLRAFPSQERVLTLRPQLVEYLSCRWQSFVAWRSLLGGLSSLCLLVPGIGSICAPFNWSSVWFLGQVCHGSLDSREWVRPHVVVQHQPPSSGSLYGGPAPWTTLLVRRLGSQVGCQSERPVRLGSLVVRGVLPLHKFMQASCHPSGVPSFSPLSEGADHRGVYQQHQGSSISKNGGAYSAVLNREEQLLLRWAESLDLTLVPQFIVGPQNVVANSLSHRQQVLGFEWTLAQEVVDELVVRWPANVDLFATALNYRLPVYFSPLNNPMAAGTDAFLQVWDGLQAYSFPPFALTRQVINKLTSSKRTFLTLIALFWPQTEWFLELLSLAVAPPLPLPLCHDLLRQPYFLRLHLNLPVLSLHAWRLFSGLCAT